MFRDPILIVESAPSFIRALELNLPTNLARFKALIVGSANRMSGGVSNNHELSAALSGAGRK